MPVNQDSYDIDGEVLAPQVKVAQIISAALIFGVLVFTGITLFIVHSASLSVELENVGMFQWLGMGAALLAMPISFVLANAMWQRCDQDMMQQTLVVATVIPAAILEGACLLNLVAMVLTKTLTVPLVMVVLCLICMLLHFPTGTKISNRVRDKQRDASRKL